MKSVQWLRRYPVVGATILIGVVGLLMLLSGHGDVRLLVGGFALGVAAWQSWGMVRSIARGEWGLDLLAVTAIVATTLVGDHWAALIVVLMLTGGEALEDYADTRAQRELSSLLERAPSTARRRVADGEFEEVPVEDITPGELVMVRPGEVVPVDGLLEQDPAWFDESSITGEPLPVEHRPGEKVLSGSVSEQTVALVRASAPARESMYQQIVALVQEAAQSRSPIVRLADRYAVPFTLFSLALAGAAWWVSGDPVRFGQVLVVATPCPLLIAAPVAFLAGTSRAASAGIVVKTGGVMETLARVRSFAFDKTGTLTHGQPEVESIEPAKGVEPDEILALAAATEQYSTHVLARAIVERANQRAVSIPQASDVVETTAAGMTAQVAGRLVAVGNAQHIEDTTGSAPPDAPIPSGRMAIHLATEHGYLGRILLADRLRTTAPETLSALRGMGVDTFVMLTGDGNSTARHVAEQVGITDVRAGLLPAEKVSAVASLPNRPVAMVGDGVNDAPVLAAADVGIAMGAKGATAASESANVVIMLDDLSRVASSVAIAQRTVRIALQAIWVGIAISVGLMLVAFWGVMPAIVGAAVQEIVDLTAILTALRAVRPGRAEQELAARLVGPSEHTERPVAQAV